MKVAVVIPVFNEAAALPGLLVELAAAGAASSARLDVILVDDGSTDGTLQVAAAAWTNGEGRPPAGALHLVKLARNQGHQRAILMGLRYAVSLSSPPWDCCLVMDGDGQDDPAALATMRAAIDGGADAVFARRSRRAEPLLWVLGYKIYQGLYRSLLGQALPVGNFCLLRRSVVERLAREGDLTHLAAWTAAYPVRLAQVPVPRRTRQAGEAKMRLWGLVDFGVAAMTASAQAWMRLFTRLALLTAVTSLLGSVAVLGIKLFSGLAIAGWASTVCLLTFGISLQAMGFMVTTAFLRQVLSRLSPIEVAAETQVIATPAPSQRESA